MRDPLNILEYSEERAMTDLESLCKKLYDSEINFVISTFWDSGYTVQLGDNMNGFLEESGCLDDTDEVARELTRMAIKHFPQSKFTLAHTERQPAHD